MKSWKGMALGAVALVLCAGQVNAQTTLRFKFKEGEKLHYQLEQKMKMAMNVAGKEFGIDMTQHMDMGWTIGKVSGDGVAEIKIQFAKAKMAMDGPMGKLEVDSASTEEPNDPVGKILYQVVKTIGGLAFDCKMDATGEVKDAKIPAKALEALKNLPGGDQMGDLFSEEGLKKMIQGGMILPKEAVAKGKTWNQKVSMKMPFGKMSGDIEFTYEGPVEKGGKQLEKIAMKPQVKIDADPATPLPIKLKSQEGKGVALFDNATGRLVEMTSDQVMEMSIEANGMNLNQRITQNTIVRLKKE
ncbi:MAG: DUF6263 family protein [Gemmataceae bacterium]|nr:DUF6263 family protein [Gemmataceae bacterium]